MISMQNASVYASEDYHRIARAIASRAVAGVYKGKLVFSLPGSSNAVKLAVEKLILPELVHLVTQLRGG